MYTVLHAVDLTQGSSQPMCPTHTVKVGSVRNYPACNRTPYLFETREGKPQERAKSVYSSRTLLQDVPPNMASTILMSLQDTFHHLMAIEPCQSTKHELEADRHLIRSYRSPGAARLDDRKRLVTIIYS